jgi:hypothetical protein
VPLYIKTHGGTLAFRYVFNVWGLWGGFVGGRSEQEGQRLSWVGADAGIGSWLGQDGEGTGVVRYWGTRSV